MNRKGFSPGDLDAALELLRTQRRLIPNGLLGGSYQLGDQDVLLDNSEANGSSLAMLAEYGGKRCLLLGDAHPDVIVESLKKLGASASKPLELDAVKIAHHGSRGNTTRELLDLIACKRFLVSTNGGNKYGHPDPQTIDSIIAHAGPGIELVFNYLSDTTRYWSDEEDQARRRYRAVYPDTEGEGAIVEL